MKTSISASRRSPGGQRPTGGRSVSASLQCSARGGQSQLAGALLPGGRDTVATQVPVTTDLRPQRPRMDPKECSRGLSWSPWPGGEGSRGEAVGPVQRCPNPDQVAFFSRWLFEAFTALRDGGHRERQQGDAPHTRR